MIIRQRRIHARKGWRQGGSPAPEGLVPPALRVLALVASGAVLLLATSAKADPAAVRDSNECVACHEVEELPLSLGHSMSEWRGSEHGRSGVTCEKCHGGNATAKDADAAHVGVLPPSDKASKVSAHNIAATCGSCHEKQYAAYKTTDHANEVTKDGDAATCVTCHGSMATSYPALAEMNARCTVCHEKRPDARAALSWLVSTKTQLLRARRMVEQAKPIAPEWEVDAIERFHSMEKDYEAIELKWHKFDMKASVTESRNLLNLAKLLEEEARLKIKIDKEKKAH